jgi:hypothetical protein
VVDEISRNNSFRILQNLYVYFAKFRIAKYTKFRESCATKFRFLIDEAKKQCCGFRAGNSSIIFSPVSTVHNEMVAPQVSMGEHTKCILTLLSSGKSNFNVLKRLINAYLLTI